MKTRLVISRIFLRKANKFTVYQIMGSKIRVKVKCSWEEFMHSIITGKNSPKTEVFS